MSPGTRKTRVKGLYGKRAVKLFVAAPPEKGRANAEVERILAKIYGVSASEVEVVRGVSGRNKRDEVGLVCGVRTEVVGEVLETLDALPDVYGG